MAIFANKNIMGVYSQTLIKQAKANKLNIEDIVFCTLCASGFNQRDAYIAAYRPTTNNPQAIDTKLKKQLKDDALQIYLFKINEDKRKEDSNLIEFERKIRAEYQKEYAATKEQTEPDNNRTTTGQVVAEPEQSQTGATGAKETRSKADIIRELNEKIDRCTDPKEQREFYKMLIDVEQMKKDIDETEEESIHYYFPVTCKDCKHSPENKPNQV